MSVENQQDQSLDSRGFKLIVSSAILKYAFYNTGAMLNVPSYESFGMFLNVEVLEISI